MISMKVLLFAFLFAIGTSQIDFLESSSNVVDGYFSVSYDSHTYSFDSTIEFNSSAQKVSSFTVTYNTDTLQDKAYARIIYYNLKDLGGMTLQKDKLIITYTSSEMSNIKKIDETIDVGYTFDVSRNNVVADFQTDIVTKDCDPVAKANYVNLMNSLITK